MLTEHGVPKFVDFGLVKEADGRSHSCGVGTYIYIAPEVLRGESHYTQNVDIFRYECLLIRWYSCGVVLFELFLAVSDMDFPIRIECRTNFVSTLTQKVSTRVVRGTRRITTSFLKNLEQALTLATMYMLRRSWLRKWLCVIRKNGRWLVSFYMAMRVIKSIIVSVVSSLDPLPGLSRSQNRSTSKGRTGCARGQARGGAPRSFIHAALFSHGDVR